MPTVSESMLLNEGYKRNPLNQIGKKYHANRKKERYRVNTRAKSDKEEKKEMSWRESVTPKEF